MGEESILESENKDTDNFADYVNRSRGTESANHIILRFSLLLYFVLLGETFLQYTFIEKDIWGYVCFWGITAVIIFFHGVEKVADVWQSNGTFIYDSFCISECDYGR